MTMEVNGRTALTYEEAAEGLGVTIGTLSMWMRERQIPY
jgi:excisionase family DNA binding protein